MPPPGGTGARAPWTWPSGKWVTSTVPLSRDSERRCEFWAIYLLYLCLKNGASQVQMCIRSQGGSFSPGSGWEATWSRTWAGTYHCLPTMWTRMNPLLKADSTGGRAVPPQSEQLHSQKVFIFTFKMTLAGRHSQSSMNIDTDKECISKVTNCIHWDKSLRKTVFCSPSSLRRTGLMWKLFSLIACLEAWRFHPMSLKIDVVGGCFMGWIFSLEKKKGVLHRWATQDVSDQST